MPQRLLTFSAEQIGTFLSEAWSAFRGASQYREVPGLEPRMGLLGEAALDRTFTLGTSLLIGVPLPEQVRQQYTTALDMRSFLQDGGWLDDPASYHQAPPDIDDFELEPGATWGGLRRWRFETLRFESGFEPRVGCPGRESWLAHETNGSAAAYVLEHEGRPRPWVVAIHGFAMGTPLVNFAGLPVEMLYEELGLNVVMPVLPLHGLRGSGRVSGSEVMQPDYVRMVHLFAQAVWDVRRILRWVRARGGERIGLYGISMGGYVSSLVSALESDLDAVIVSIPMVDFATSAQDNMPWIMQRYDDDIEMDWEAVRAITHVVSPLAMIPKVPKGRRFIFAGIADRVVRPGQPRALWRHWGEPEIEWFSGGHVLGMMNPALKPFLRKALDQSGLRYRKRGGAGKPRNRRQRR